MQHTPIRNPFIVGKYVSDSYFCDREQVLQAIAREGVARNITSAAFIRKYNLGSASSVQAAVKLLLKNDIVTQGEGQYRIYDFFFSKWLARY